jgi:hypothetical protein
MPGVDFGFLAHHSRERPDVMLAYVQTMAGQGLRARFGANTWLPRLGTAYVQDRLAEWTAHADYAFADPEVCRMELPYTARGRSREEHAYLGIPNPLATRGRFVDAVLRAQTGVGARILVTPHLVHGVSNTARELNATLDFARRAASHPLAATHRLLFAVEATEGVFASDPARNDLLNQLVELDPGWLYLRMRVKHPISRSQYANEEALRGLRHAVESLSTNGWEIVLPQSGLAGWMMLGVGAKTFGAGTSTTMQRCDTPGSGGGGGNAPLHWYFCSNLLGFVLAEELPALQAVRGFAPCPCPFCAASPPRAGARFDSEAAGLHYLWWCAKYADAVKRSPTPLSEVQRQIADAVSFWQRAQRHGVLLDARSTPNHLAVWDAVSA